MAFGLSKINAYGIEVAEPTRGKFIQVLEMDITGATADVSLDIGNPAGTFWTAVANANANKAVAQIFAKVSKHLSISVPQLYAKTLIRSGA